MPSFSSDPFRYLRKRATGSITGGGDAGAPPSAVTSAWNPADKGANQVLSNSNRTVTQSTSPGTEELVRGTQSRTSASLRKVEFTINSKDGTRPIVGLCDSGMSVANGGFGGDTSQLSVGVFGNGLVFVNGSATATNVGTLVVGEALSIEQTSATSVTVQRQSGSAFVVAVTAGTYFPGAQTGNSAATSQATINTGQAAFVIAASGGITAWG